MFRKIATSFVTLGVTLAAVLVAQPAQAAVRTYAHIQSNASSVTRGYDEDLRVRVRTTGQFPATARIFVSSRPVDSKRVQDGVVRFTIDGSKLPDNKRVQVTVKINPDPENRRSTQAAVKVKDEPGGTAIVRAAKAQLGDRYAYGGSGPSRWDCSGLVAHAVRVATGQRLPHSSSGIRDAGKRVSSGSKQPGDVVWTRGHVSVYAGNGYVVEAARPGTKVRVVKQWQRGAQYLRF